MIIACRICRGHGEVMVAMTATDTCPRCHGTGKGAYDYDEVTLDEVEDELRWGASDDEHRASLTAWLADEERPDLAALARFVGAS